MSARSGARDESAQDIPRAWARVDATGLLDEHGYLYEAGTWLAREQIFALEALEEEPCLVLLGEAGLGKSHVLRRLEERLRAAGEPVTARRFSGMTEPAFVALWGDPSVLAWKERGKRLHLLLDGLDESPLTPERAADHLIELLRAGGDLSRLRLRVTGRTFAWTERLETSFRQIFGKPTVLQLLPLRRAQVKDRLAGVIEDADRVLEDLDARGLGPLASRPLTLQLLAETLKTSRDVVIEGKLWDLYDRALLHRRHESRPTKDVQRSKELHRSADVLGAATVFAACESFSAELDLSSSLDALVNEELPAEDRDRRVELLREALLLAGFEGPREERRWEHPTFAVFHAARWLAERARSVDEVVRWLQGSGSGSLDALPAQVEATAAWLASRDRALFDRLLAEAPGVLLRCDPLSHDAERKGRIVVALLADAERVMSQGWRTLTLIRNLGFVQAIDGFEECIRDATRSLASRALALRFAARSDAAGMLSTVLRLVLDDKEPVALRGLALEIVEDQGSTEARRQLAPLIDERTARFHQGLAPIVLRAVWRADRSKESALSLQELFDLIDLFVWLSDSSFRRFPGGEFCATLRDEELPFALEMAIKALEQGSAHRRQRLRILMDSLAARVMESLSNGLIRTRFVGFLIAYERLMFSFPSAVRVSGDASRTPVEDLVEAIVATVEAVGSRLEYTLSQMIAHTGLEWRLARVASARQVEHERVWAGLAFLRFREIVEVEEESLSPEALKRHLDTIDAFRRALSSSGELLRVSRWYFESGVALDAPWVRDQREWQAQKKREDAEGKRLADRLRAKARSEFERLKGDPVDGFWKFVHWLRARGVPDNSYVVEGHVQITTTEWWRGASAEERSLLLRCAASYLENGDPETETWYGKNITSYRADAGYLALRLLEEQALDVLESFSASVWMRWMPALVSTVPIEHGEGTAHHRLLWMARKLAPDAFVECLDREVVEDIRSSSSALVLQRFGEIHSVAIAERMRRHLETAPPMAIRSLLAQVAAVEANDAKTLALQIFEARHEGKFATDRAVHAAAYLASADRTVFWNAIWPLCEKRDEVAWEILELVWRWKEVDGSSLNDLVPDRLVLLWEGLSAKFRYGSRETDREGVYSVVWGEEVRDAALQALVSLGTDEATAALYRLADAHPELPWLRSNALRAEASAKARRWTPWTAEDLACASNSPPSIDDPAVRELVKILSTLYESSAKRVCRDAGISTIAIRSDGPPLDVWDDVVREALNADRLLQLVSVACTEYRGNTTLRSIARRLGVVAQTE